MKIYLALVFACCVFSANAENDTLYVAIKSGLNIRTQASTTAAVAGKIPYGTKLILAQDENGSVPVTTEGLNGTWRKVTYGGKTGFIIDSYLLPMAPPKAGIETIKEFLDATVKPFAPDLLIGKKILTEDDASQTLLTKSFYQDGSEVHRFEGYEFHSVAYIIPRLTVQQGFLLLRLFPEFSEYISEAEVFTSKNKVVKKKGIDYTYTVDKEVFGNTTWVRKIRLTFEDGAIYEFELYQIDSQLVIYYSAGL